MDAEALAESVQQSGGASGSPATLTPDTSPRPIITSTAPGQSGGFTAPSPAPPDSAQQVTVSFNQTQNAVIVRGGADAIAEAKALLEALDQPPPQVMIEAAIIEVTLDDELQFGLNWRGIEERFRGTFTDAPSGQVTSNFPGFALTYINTDIEAALNVLASITKVEVVSRPSLVALNNEEASLQVSPIPMRPSSIRPAIATPALFSK
jgi:general secretion pathway protein D